MREWIEELSTYIENKEEKGSELVELAEEVGQAVLDTDSLLQASDQLESAYSALMEKIEHVSS